MSPGFFAATTSRSVLRLGERTAVGRDEDVAAEVVALAREHDLGRAGPQAGPRRAAAGLHALHEQAARDRQAEDAREIAGDRHAR